MSRVYVDFDLNSYLKPHSAFKTGGSHRYRYREHKATKDIRFCSFFSRTIRLWNKLPVEKVESNFLVI